MRRTPFFWSVTSLHSLGALASVSAGHRCPATTLRDRIRRFQRLERFQGRADNIDRVVAAKRLGKHVLDASRLDDGTDTAAGDYARARRCRLKEHSRRA